MILRIDTFACCLYSYQLHSLILQERVEHADGIATTSDSGYHYIRQSALRR
ncbi:hypothetical protein D3C79_1088780 [compost metagenome]